MIDYAQFKNYMNAPIGAMMPWVGGSSQSQVPPTWLICDGRELNTEDYPELASILKETAPGVFTLPFLEEHELKNMSGDNPLSGDGAPSGNLLASGEPGLAGMNTLEEPPTDFNFPIGVVWDTVPNFTMNARIEEIDLSGPIRNEIIAVYPRKLGVDHTPAHTHRGDGGERIPSTAWNDKWAPVFHPYSAVVRNGEVVTRMEAPIAHDEEPRALESNTLPITWLDARDQPTIDSYIQMNRESSKTYPNGQKLPTNDMITVEFESEFLSGNSYTDSNSDAIINTQVPLVDGQFPIETMYSGKRNSYEDGSTNEIKPIHDEVYSVCLNHNFDDFSSIGLFGHSHGFYSFSVEVGRLRLPRNLFVNNIQNEIDAEINSNVASVTMNTNTAGMTSFIIIKAY